MYSENKMVKNQRFFCILFGATFTLTLNLLLDFMFLCIFLNIWYLNLAKIPIETNTFAKNY